MKIDKNKSKQFKSAIIKNRLNLIKITSSIAISVTLISFLLNNSNNINNKINSTNYIVSNNSISTSTETLSTILFDDENQVVNKISIPSLDKDSDNYDETFYNLCTNGNILVLNENNGKYDKYKINNLRLLNIDEDKTILIDPRKDNRDILGNNTYESYDYNKVVTLRQSSLLYEIYLDKYDELEITNNQINIKLKDSELREYIENWDKRIFNNIINENSYDQKIESNNSRNKSY